MVLKQQARLGAYWLIGSQIINMGTVFFVAVFLARLLEIYQFGLMTLSTVIFLLGSLLTTGAFRETLIVRQNLKPETISGLFWLNLALSLGVGLVCLAAAAPVARFLDAAEFEPLMWVVAGSIVANGIGTIPGAIRVVKRDFARIGSQTAIITIALAPVAILMALYGFGAMSAVMTTFIYHLLTCLLNWYYAGWKPQSRFSMRAVEPARPTLLVMLGQQTLDVANSQFDRGIIGSLLGPHALGLYSIGRRLNDLMTDAIIAPANSVTMPLVASIQGNVERLRSAYVQTLSLTMILAVPANLGLLAVGDLAIHVLFGEKWLEATPVLRAFVFLGLLGAISSVQRSIVQGGGRPDAWLRIQVVHTLANLAAVVAASSFGITAIAGAMVLRAVLLSPLAFMAAGKMTGVGARAHAGVMLKPIQAGIVMLLTVLLARTLLPVGMQPVAALAILVSVGAAAYFAALGLLARSQLTHALSLVMPKRFVFRS
ncbi:oligosaccharide flippase family protein [Aquamicrobium terrae]